MWVLGAMFRVLPMGLGRLFTLPMVWGWLNHWNRPRRALMLAGARLEQPNAFFYAARTYATYAFSLVERAYVMSGRVAPVWALGPGGSSSAVLERAILDPRPLVLLGSHLGTLEMAVGALETRGRVVRAVAVRDEGAGTLLSGVGDAADNVGGATDTIVADGTMQAGLRMLRALRSGEVLALKADRALPGTAETHLRTHSFLGAEAAFPIGPFELARAARARIVAISVVRRDSGIYQLLAEEVATDGGTAEQWQGRWVEILERHLRDAPHSWFNFFPFWIGDAALCAAEPLTIPRPLRVWAGLPAAAVVAIGAGSASVVSAALGFVASALIAAVAAMAGATLGLDLRANGRAWVAVTVAAIVYSAAVSASMLGTVGAVIAAWVPLGWAELRRPEGPPPAEPEVAPSEP